MARLVELLVSENEVALSADNSALVVTARYQRTEGPSQLLYSNYQTLTPDSISYHSHAGTAIMRRQKKNS